MERIEFRVLSYFLVMAMVLTLTGGCTRCCLLRLGSKQALQTQGQAEKAASVGPHQIMG